MKHQMRQTIISNQVSVELLDSKEINFWGINENAFNTIISIILTFLIIFFLYITYYIKLKKTNPKLPTSGYVFIFQLYIDFIHNLTIQILGKRFEKITPFFVYLFLYIMFSNVISIFGLTNPTSSLSVTLSLGFVTFIGIFFVGFKFQRLSFLKKYTINIVTKKQKTIPIMINPLNIVGQLTPLISLSFRLWGNIFAGSLITSMVFLGMNEFFLKISSSEILSFFTAFVLIPFHLYFDIISGLIQTLVFVLLTMIYWKMECK